MFTYQQALLEAADRLNQAESATAKLDALVLLCLATGRDKIHLYTYPHTLLTLEEYNMFDGLLGRREKGEPIAYILGKKAFWEAEFYVHPGVLIPRPDTETLITVVLDAVVDKNAPLKLCDLGTGSGAIALSLAQALPNAAVTAVDISAEALECATKNAADLKLLERVTLLKSYWFENIPLEKFDGIISNPPYIPEEDISMLMRDVRDYEPHLALSGGKDGLDAYRAIIEKAFMYLKPNGFLAFEVGATQAPLIVELLEMATIFTDITVHKDLHAIERVVFARVVI